MLPYADPHTHVQTYFRTNVLSYPHTIESRRFRKTPVAYSKFKVRSFELAQNLHFKLNESGKSRPICHFAWICEWRFWMRFRRFSQTSHLKIATSTFEKFSPALYSRDKYHVAVRRLEAVEGPTQKNVPQVGHAAVSFSPPSTGNRYGHLVVI